MATKKRSATRPLPPALAKRAIHAADAKIARLLEEAKADLTLIARRKAQIVDAFYDIGEALRRLKRKEIVAALGRRSFAEVCEKDARVSVSQAGRRWSLWRPSRFSFAAASLPTNCSSWRKAKWTCFSTTMPAIARDSRR